MLLVTLTVLAVDVTAEKKGNKNGGLIRQILYYCKLLYIMTGIFVI